MTHKISEEAKAKIEPIKAAKDNLINALNGKLALGIEALDSNEVGATTDAIKDLAEAEKMCWEACYYKSVVEAMEKAAEDENAGYSDGRMGYDAWRYADGRYAPTGRGTRSGYMPPYMNEPEFWDGMSDSMLGYTHDGSTSANGRSAMNGNTTRMNGTNGRMGYTDPIDELSQLWQEADMDTKRRMKGALEEMARTIGE